MSQPPQIDTFLYIATLIHYIFYNMTNKDRFIVSKSEKMTDLLRCKSIRCISNFKNDASLYNSLNLCERLVKIVCLYL